VSKTVKEFVTHWGPSLNDWGDGTEQRFVIERDEKLLKQGVESGGRRMQKSRSTTSSRKASSRA